MSKNRESGHRFEIFLIHFALRCPAGRGNPSLEQKYTILIGFSFLLSLLQGCISKKTITSYVTL